MATTRTFQDMLNEYLPNELFQDELIKRDWYLTNVQKDNEWKGGDIIVPFMGAEATSLAFGKLTHEDDISEFDPVRGKISGYKEVWGSLVFNETDIMQHDGRVNEQSFLRILPDQIEQFMNYMKMAVSINLLCGPHFAIVTDATNAATGQMVVDKIDRFTLGQKSELKDNDSVKIVVYAIAIDINSNTVTFSATRGGLFVDLSAYTVAQSAKFYHDGILDAGGVVTENFFSMRSALLSGANGGSTTIHGQTKTAYPALQAVNISGTGITATNLLDRLFDAWTTMKIKAKAANPSTCLMSYKHLGSIMKAVENGITSGGGASIQRVIVKEKSANVKYGWAELEIVGVKGSFTIVAVQEMDDDIIAFLDMSAMTFRTNGYFMKKKSPDGVEYFRKRAQTGYKIICDVCLFGEQEFRKPATCGIIYGINY